MRAALALLPLLVEKQMLALVKRPGGAVYALFIALILTVFASGFSIQKSMSYFGAAMQYNDAGTAYWEKSAPFLVFTLVQIVFLFYLASGFGVLAAVAADLVFLILFYLSISTNYYMSFALPAIFFVGVLSYYMRDGDNIEGALKRMGLHTKDTFNDLKIGFGTFCAAIAVTVLIGSIAGALNADDSVAVKERIFAMPLAVLLWAVTITPLGEEALFRGLFLQIFSKYGNVFAAVTSSVLFAASHVLYGSYIELVGAFAIALLFCFVTIKRKSLVPAVAAHALFNAFSIIVALAL